MVVWSLHPPPVPPDPSSHALALPPSRAQFESPVPRLVFALLPTWLSHLTSTNVVLEDDVVLLAAQERALAERAARGASFAQACYLPHPMDAFTTACAWA